jgi:hypothetical protein
MSKIALIFPSFGVGILFMIFGGVGSCRDMQGAVNRTSVQKSDRLANGVWGGEHIRMEVTDSGADIEYDCAHSTVDEPIVLDSEGNFEVKGKYLPQHGGPIRKDEENKGTLVHYVGHASGKELSLTITNPDKKETIGTFTLTRGSEGRVMKCR